MILNKLLMKLKIFTIGLLINVGDSLIKATIIYYSLVAL